ncbi:hypothetical protein [Limnohabitans sp. 15K]|uniref:hypothetical protein n=1 Tax=Limnohabitans sp. 15K TaxID=1100706 RepID=UPI000C1F8B7C|nr:hypothetical protein [Limnohabitans sp. 15K]PIT82157.1 hypothetical protein B9Z40_10520 [Limnohabitans sp. 15K]
MDALLNALMAIGLLLVLILVIYLIDRVNSIESETRKVVTTLNENAAKLATPSMGLSAKKLWDAMTGRSNEGLDPQALADLRSRYPVILSKHAEALYKDGFKDGILGSPPSDPKNTKEIVMAKGPVESWIPTAQANALYQCGLSASQTPEAEWGPIRASMDEAGEFLWSKAQLDATSPLSEWLMPSSSSDATATPGA